MAYRDQTPGRIFPGSNEMLPVQTSIPGHSQMIYNPQLSQQMYSMHARYPMPQARFHSQPVPFQPQLLGTFRPVIPIAGQITSERGSVATTMQSAGVMAPDSGKFLEEQKKLERERNFQLQQQRLKQFNVANRRSNINSTQYLDNLFGSKIDNKQPTPSSTQIKAPKIEQEKPNKSLPQKFSPNQELVSSISKEGKKKENYSLPETVFKHSVKDTKALDNMMNKCVNLNGPQKAATFQKPSVKDIQPCLQHTANFSSSEKACDWKRVQINELQEMFTLPKPRFPKWCCKEFAPPLYLQVENECTNQGTHSIDTTLLYPILTSSGLQREILGQIWELCNQTNPGQLTSEELYAILSLIGLAQMGHTISSTEILHSIPQPIIPVLQYFMVAPTAAMNILPEEQTNSSKSVLETSGPDNESPTAPHQKCNIFMKSDDGESVQKKVDPSIKIINQHTEETKSNELDSMNDDAHDFGDFKSAMISTESTTDLPAIQTIDNTVDDFDDFKQAPLTTLDKKPFLTSFQKFQEANSKNLDSDLMSPEEDKYSIFRALQENTESDISSWGFTKDNTTEKSIQNVQNVESKTDLTSDKTSSATINADDDFGDFLSADANVEPVKDEFPGFESFDATNSDEFGNFASFHTDTIPTVTVSDKNVENLTFPIHNQIMTSEIVLNIQNKDSISLAESQSVSSLELGTFDGITSGCHSRESKSSLSRHGSIPSLNFKASTIDNSLSRQGSVRSLDLKGSSSDNMDEFGEMQSFATSRKISSHSHSPSPSFDMSKNTEEELSSQPSVAGNGLTHSMMPFTVTDRYSFIRLNGTTNVEDIHISEWMKCLESCHNLIRNATDIFNQMNSSTVCNTVIGTEEGSNYIKNLVEIYKVVNRIATSAKSSGKQTDQLRQLLQDIEQSWNSITVFIASSSMLPEEKVLDFSSCVLLNEPENLQKACGICLLNVDAKNKLFDTEDYHKLTYGGRQYHATCANFWVNCVDPLLPSLPFPHLL